tara:strand:+ start:9179 stop:11629 length:2451 start_codon:yes stop_codon:yes gene_type:complete
MLRFASLLVAVPVLAVSATAQATVDAPLLPLTTSVYPGVLEFDADHAQLEHLGLHEDLRMTRWPVPGGGVVELELSQVHPDFTNMKRFVDGVEREVDRGNQTLWKGQVRGDAPGSAWMSFSSTGCYGWYEVNGELFHMTAFAAPNNDWSHAGVRIYPEALNHSIVGIQPREIECQVTQRDLAAASVSVPQGPQSFGSQATLEMRIAIETDFQYFNNWNSLAAATNFLTQLLAAISDRYEEQVDVIATYPYVGMYTSNNDPWDAQSGGASAMLSQFRQAWSGNIPENAHLGHFISGQGLGGGVAHVDVLCSQNWGFGVSGGVNGGTGFPVNQGGDTWDFVVIAHELGHQVGTGHTHSYNPPIDTCGSSGGTCINSGTIMSYCHTCSGGMNNITTYFHPIVVANMRADAVQSCIPVYVPPCTEEGMEPNDSCGGASALIGAGSFESLQAVQGNTDFFEVQVPAGQSYAFVMTHDPLLGDVDVRLWDSACAGLADQGIEGSGEERVTYTNSSGGSQSVYLEVFLDDAVPCNVYDLDIAQVAAPCTTDVDVFTGNYDCAAPAPLQSGVHFPLHTSVVEPDHYTFCVAPNQDVTIDLLFEVEDGDLDMFLFEGEDCSGPVVGVAMSTDSVERIEWFNPSLDTPQRLTLLVVVAPGSFHACVENAIAIGYQAGDCDAPQPAGPIGSTYCSPANLNSLDVPAVMTAIGQEELALQDVTLQASGLPLNQFGFFIVSATQGFVANPGGSMGNLCLAGDIGRYQDQVMGSGALGMITLEVDLLDLPTNPPQPVLVGQTWNFQAWYRDVVLGTPRSNFTDAVSITFE